MSFRVLAAGLVALTLLAACQSEEERAEEYYQSALSLLSEGDVDRALVELRNVFDNDGFHQDARRLYADLVLERGDLRDAYSQYLLLVEQYPDLLDVRRTLVELAMAAGNWDEVERHGRAAIELAPDAPESRAFAAVIAYRDAILQSEDQAAAEAAAEARAVLAEEPGLLPARRIVIDWLMQGPDPSRAREDVTLALEQAPADRSLHMARLQLDSLAGDSAAIGDDLQTMYALFPEDTEITGLLIRWYLSEQDYEGAEAFLRGEAGPDDGDPAGHLAVVELLARTDRAAAAETELDRLAAANPGTDLGLYYGALAAAMRFDTAADDAARAAAMAEIAEATAGAAPTERVNDAKMILARMRAAAGDTAAAQELVEEILAADPSHVDALKARAVPALQAGELGRATADLRTALDQAPRDPEILMLMAEAQRQAGNMALAQQRLALAVEASGSGIRESLVYGRFLIGQERYLAAKTVLSDALSRAPGNLEIAALLGDALLRDGDTAQLRALARQLEGYGDPEADRLARSFTTAVLLSQNQIDESLALLRDQIAESGNADMASVLQMLRIQLQTGRIEEARTYLDDLRAENPENAILQMFDADLSALSGDAETAIALYRDIVAADPGADLVVQKLYGLLTREGRPAEAAEVVAAGVAATPDSLPLLLLQALVFEREERIGEATEIYERLLAANPGNVVVTNNLASLLSSHSDDPADLARAAELAGALAGIDNPAVLDTLGWIQVRTGDLDSAIPNLEAAVRGLPENPVAAVHLGFAYAEADRPDEARAELERGLSLAGEQPVPQEEMVRARLEELGG